MLFNLDKARQSIRERKFALLVEGQMDCITAYMAGFENVLATSGTAFTEMQARLLSRYTQKLFINFDPDNAGANAAEKSIALLTEENFDVRVVTLEAGLDPDRFIRGTRHPGVCGGGGGGQAPFRLPVRARHPALPPRNAEGKTKALNYLLPHIRRMPSRIARDEFAADAAQKLGIDSAVLREELHQAARKRRDQVHVSERDSLTEAERVLLRAAASPAQSRICLRVCQALQTQSHYFEGLRSPPC